MNKLYRLSVVFQLYNKTYFSFRNYFENAGYDCRPNAPTAKCPAFPYARSKTQRLKVLFCTFYLV